MSFDHDRLWAHGRAPLDEITPGVIRTKFGHDGNHGEGCL